VRDVVGVRVGDFVADGTYVPVLVAVCVGVWLRVKRERVRENNRLSVVDKSDERDSDKVTVGSCVLDLWVLDIDSEPVRDRVTLIVMSAECERLVF